MVTQPGESLAERMPSGSGAALDLLNVEERVLLRSVGKHPGGMVNGPTIATQHGHDRLIVIDHGHDPAPTGDGGERLRLEQPSRATIVVTSHDEATLRQVVAPHPGESQSAVGLVATGEVDDAVAGHRMGLRHRDAVSERPVIVHRGEEGGPVLGALLDEAKPVTHVREHSVDVEDCDAGEITGIAFGAGGVGIEEVGHGRRLRRNVVGMALDLDAVRVGLPATVPKVATLATGEGDDWVVTSVMPVLWTLRPNRP